MRSSVRSRSDAHVAAEVQDRGEEDSKEASDQHEGLSIESARRDVVRHEEHIVVLCNDVLRREARHHAASGVQIGRPQGVSHIRNGVGRDHLHVVGALGKNDRVLQLLHEGVHETAREGDAQNVAASVILREVRGAGQVVAREPVNLPASEEHEPRSDVQLDDALAMCEHVRAGDVANLVTVVGLRGADRQVLRDGVDAVAVRAVHVVEARELALQLGSLVFKVKVLLDGHVAPVRRLHLPGLLRYKESSAVANVKVERRRLPRARVAVGAQRKLLLCLAVLVDRRRVCCIVLLEERGVDARRLLVDGVSTGNHRAVRVQRVLRGTLGNGRREGRLGPSVV
mmetsp:Transcript_9886/g.40065  ORF Transcript_9886/g.40065 Transcript_9886/m.40065 type:complete len:341 (+) Transcript_9886:143-1165(+)